LIDDPLRWLFSLEVLGMKFGLENMTTLLAELDDPHRHFPSLLIAGTNGKGSVTVMVDTALRRAGYRSARYTSPHLERVEERFVIDGEDVTTDHLRSALDRIRTAVDALLVRGALGNPPTFFECTTAAAFLLFRRAAVDVAVLEVGLGGRLDATNVVTPLATAITNIEFDHQAQLGSTIEEIAREKAGIIKPGIPVVIGRMLPAARDVIRATADDLGAPLIVADDVATDTGAWRPSLAGAHQFENARVAAALLGTLGDFELPVPESAVRYGIEHAQWPGRLERFRRGEVEVLLDAAHNPAGARALGDYLRDAGWDDATLVFAAMADKDAPGMLAALVPHVGRIVCTTGPTPRAAGAAELARIARTLGPDLAIESIEDPSEALARACATSSRVVAAGSMFLIGPLRGILR
jgi:dihydrofolate synthase/folylpolyglutamate synthase